MSSPRCCALLAAVLFCACLSTAAPPTAPTQRVLVLVDESALPEIQPGLETYFAHVKKTLPVDFKVVSDKLYEMKPPAIRALLQREHKDSKPPVVGAIMVGPIPHAVRGNPKEIITPVPLYYEDFDAEWIDDNGDGFFDRAVMDRRTNATEIWTAWWVPPANEPAEQITLLQGWLKKLDRYYRGELDGRDSMLFLAGNGNSVEITEAWTVLLMDAMKSTAQRVARVYSLHGQMEYAVVPEPGHEFAPEDLENALEQHRYQHVHILTHGAPDGFYWEQAAIRGTQLDFTRFKETGANIITTSGCSNGNFRGRNSGEADYARSIGNLLIFSPHTITVAYYGATSPQSTGVFAVVHTPLIEFLDPQRGSYFADGYFRLRNSDVCWGTEHYMFRGVDGKALFGDPFARFRAVAPAGETAEAKPAEAAACPE